MKNLLFFTLLFLLVNGYSTVYGQDSNICPIVSVECLNNGQDLLLDFGTYENASLYINEDIIIIGSGFQEYAFHIQFDPDEAPQIIVYGIDTPVDCANDQLTFQVGNQLCIFEDGVISVCNPCFPDEEIACPEAIICGSNNYGILYFEEPNTDDVFLHLNPTINVFGGLNNPINGVFNVSGGDENGTLFVDFGTVLEGNCDGSLQIETQGRLCVYEDGFLLEGNCYPFYEESDNISENNDLCNSIYQECLPDFINLLEQEEENIRCKTFNGMCDANGNINRSGKVSIGTSVFYPDFQLLVKEGILADRAKVEFCEDGGWCDYVFNDDYELISLDSLRLYINDFGHLPNIPSAEFVNEQGSFSLKWVITKQQEKIEEAYLYLFSLNNEVDELLFKLEELEIENAKLK